MLDAEVIIGDIIKGNCTKPRQASLGGHFLSVRERKKEQQFPVVSPPPPPYPKEYVATQELDRVADDLTAPRADCAHGQRQPCSKERRLGRGMWNYFSLRWQGLQRTSQARWAQTGHELASRPLEYLEAPVCTALVPHPVRALHFQTATLLPF